MTAEFEILKLGKRDMDFVRADEIYRRDYEPRIRHMILTAFQMQPESDVDMFLVLMLIVGRLRLTLDR